MYPNVYLESDFTKEFDNYSKNLSVTSFHSTKEIRAKHESLRRIHDFLMSSNIYSDFSIKDVENCITAENGISNTLKEQIIRSTFKKDVYTSERKLILNSNETVNTFNEFSFFNGDSFETSHEKSQKLGRIMLGKNFLDKPFFLNHSLSSESTDQTLFQVQQLKHPCSGLVIIDKYLFVDSDRLHEKMPNLLRVIEWLMPEGLLKQFEVSIITENTKSQLSNIISKKFKKITDYFGDKISLHVYAPNHLAEIETSDRFLLTNYALISIPHPFDRPTTISCNFYPSLPEDFSNFDIENPENYNIIKGYRTWRSKLDVAKKIVKKTPIKIGTVQYVWSLDKIEHSIFLDEKN